LAKKTTNRFWDKLNTLFVGLLLVVVGLWAPAHAVVIYEDTEVPVGNEKVIIKKVEIVEQNSASIKVKTTYIIFPDISGEVEFWMKPDHTNSVFEWEAVQAWTGYNADVLEIKLRPDVMAAVNKKSVESTVLTLFINLTDDNWFELEVPYSKVWSLD